MEEVKKEFKRKLVNSKTSWINIKDANVFITLDVSDIDRTAVNEYGDTKTVTFYIKKSFLEGALRKGTGASLGLFVPINPKDCLGNMPRGQ
jgi:hypothetical protein